MIVVGGNGDPNPNASWLGSRGMWLTYVIFIVVAHFFLISIPFLSIPFAWTLTNVVHNMGSFMILHILKGAPWEPLDQGAARRLTHWEQIDYGIQFTRTRKFLMIAPVILFFLASFYTRYETGHFIVNFASMLIAVIPKLPQLHGVRIFGINKY
jgi:hypothetical protein